MLSVLYEPNDCGLVLMWGDSVADRECKNNVGIR